MSKLTDELTPTDAALFEVWRHAVKTADEALNASNNARIEHEKQERAWRVALECYGALRRIAEVQERRELARAMDAYGRDEAP